MGTEGALWKDVLKNKYLKTTNLNGWPRSRPASHVWRGILKTRNTLRTGVKWEIGNGDWDVMKVNELPPCVSSLILNLPPLNANVDSPIWKGPGDGKFSTCSAYRIIYGNLGLEEDWSWMWKLRLPQKLKSFLWTVMHGKVLINQLREKRGLSSDPSCPSCNEVEDINHLFRTCYKAKAVWLAMFGRIKLNTDGCRKLGGDGGFGGLFRDEAGTWLCGYYGRIPHGTSLENELWAIYKGLTVLLQRRWKKNHN
ncbi:hypothetical protein ACSBR1_018369 [Camellia fascicularis]